MNILTFVSFLILTIIILTVVFGIISYFMYKARDKKQDETITYKEELQKQQKEFLFFYEVKDL